LPGIPDTRLFYAINYIIPVKEKTLERTSDISACKSFVCGKYVFTIEILPGKLASLNTVLYLWFIE